MHYVYVLISLKDGKLYIGSTSDLKVRFKKHREGFVLATKHRRPLTLIYYEAYLMRRDAMRRELYLKGGLGHKQMQIQLGETFRAVKYKYF